MPRKNKHIVPDESRGTGRTTAQILAAPQGATYVVHTRVHAEYVTALAAHLKRPDIRVISNPRPEMFYGKTGVGAVVFDHYLPFSTEAGGARYSVIQMCLRTVGYKVINYGDICQKN